jgi:C_GCAxxG_C_C family probable redox protein
MSAHSEKAKELFKQGYSCSQAVFSAYLDMTGLDFTTALKLSSSFGGGIGRMREVCGAVSGMLMVLGYLYGYTVPNGQNKAEYYARVRDVAGRFRELNGSIICRELLGLSAANGGAPEERTPDYYAKRPCVELVGDAAEILDKYIEENPPSQKSD